MLNVAGPRPFESRFELMFARYWHFACVLFKRTAKPVLHNLPALRVKFLVLTDVLNGCPKGFVVSSLL